VGYDCSLGFLLPAEHTWNIGKQHVVSFCASILLRRVASLIFGVHCTVLVILIVLCTRQAFHTRWQYLEENWKAPPKIGVAQDIFFGFCSGLLGVSGFETSANFIEEQKPGLLSHVPEELLIIHRSLPQDPTEYVARSRTI
jgi:hypothetical protein